MIAITTVGPYGIAFSERRVSGGKSTTIRAASNAFVATTTCRARTSPSPWRTRTSPSSAATSCTSTPVAARSAEHVVREPLARVPDEGEVARAVPEGDLVELRGRPGDGRPEQRLRIVGQRSEPVGEGAIVAVGEDSAKRVGGGLVGTRFRCTLVAGDRPAQA